MTLPIQAFPGGTVDSAASGNDALARYMRWNNAVNLAMADRLGLDIFSGSPAEITVAADCPACPFTVVGKDGDFIIKITLPQNLQATTPVQQSQMAAAPQNANLQAIQHRLQKSPDVTFSQPALIFELPLTYDTVITDHDPNKSYFWRLQSRFDGGNWNDFVTFQNPLFCGPFAVYSQLQTVPNSELTMSPATTVDGTSALSQDGVSTKIDVLAKTWNVSGQQIAYGSGDTDPGVYGTFFIYALDPTKAGGSVTFRNTANSGDLTASGGVIYFGAIKTTAGGGATGFGGGQGGGGCVVTDTGILLPDASQMAAQLLKKFSKVAAVDGGVEELQADPKPHLMPCFSLTGRDGSFLRGASSTHWLLRSGGPPERLVDLHAPEVLRTRQGNAEIVAREFLGVRLVWELKLSRTKTYCADGWWSHNKMISDLP